MKAWHHQSAWSRVLDIFRSLGQRPLAVNLALAACKAAGLWQLALQIFWSSEIDAYSYSTLVGACCESSQWEVASSCALPTAAANVLLTFLARDHTLWPRALQLFSALPPLQVQIDEISHTAVLQAQGQSLQWSGSFQILEEMTRRSLEGNCVTHCAAIGAQGGGPWQQSLRPREQLPHADLALWNAQLGTWAEGHCWPMVLQSLEASKLEPDLSSYATAMRCLKEAGQWRQSLYWSGRYMTKTLQPLSSTCSACGSARHWQAALQLPFILAEPMDGHFLGALIYACQEAAQWVSALACARPRGSLKPSAVGLNAAIIACGEGHAWAEALSLWHDSRGVRGNDFTAAAVIEALGKANEVQLALELLQSMEGDLSATAFNAALAVCAWAEQKSELFHACGHFPSPWDRYRACLGEKSTSLNEGEESEVCCQQTEKQEEVEADDVEEDAEDDGKEPMYCAEHMRHSWTDNSMLSRVIYLVQMDLVGAPRRGEKERTPPMTVGMRQDRQDLNAADWCYDGDLRLYTRTATVQVIRSSSTSTVQLRNAQIQVKITEVKDRGYMAMVQLVQSRRGRTPTLLLNLVSSVGLPEMPAIELLAHFLRGKWTNKEWIEYLGQGHGERDVQGIIDTLNGPLGMRGLRVQYQGKKKIVSGITQKPARHLWFSHAEYGNVSVQEYFLKKYNTELKYPHLPCLQWGQSCVPMELVTILGGQHNIEAGKQRPEYQAALARMTLSPP
ncbi:unnamed protein product [Durusdinium trenchii]|uniref:PAZ domain-containing protein n=1 Tax=Durusdinium trenchii TaxID=1381693 RepID=A0ABP0RP28_9DINO